MARLRDLPAVWRTVGAWGLLKRVYQQMGEDNLLVWASALAYSWLFALFPFILILMSLMPLLPDQWKNEGKNYLAIAVYQLPKDAADQIWINISPRVDRLLNNPPRGLLSIGIVLTLWAASGGVNMTMSAIDICYEVKHQRPFYKQRPLAIFLTLIVVVLILSVLVLIPIGTVATDWAVKLLAERRMEKYLPLVYAWQFIRYGLGLSLMLMVVGLAYYFGPNVKQKWVWVSPGAAFTVGVWMLLGWGFRVYIDRYGKYDETYGTIGGVAILLLVFYIDSVILLLGAEINSEVDKALGQLPEEGQGVKKPEPDSLTLREGEGERQGDEETGRQGEA